MNGNPHPPAAVHWQLQSPTVTSPNAQAVWRPYWHGVATTTAPYPIQISAKDQQPEPDAQQVKDFKDFATSFKRRRIKLGYTQTNVGRALAEVQGTDFSQTTICRFETLQLSYKNALKLRPHLEKWLEEAEKSGTQHREDKQSSSSPERRRKRRAFICADAKETLERHYHGQPKPSLSDMSTIADSLSLDKEVVRVWFCNRRQREKRLCKSIE